MTTYRLYYWGIPVLLGFLLIWTIISIRGDEAPFEPQFEEEESKPEIIVHPVDNSPLLGSTFSLNCETKGVPTPVVQWYKDGKRIKTAFDLPGTSNYATSPNLLNIYSFTSEQEGSYYCNASNHIGWVQSRTANVKIAYLNDFTNPPTSQHVIMGEPVTLRCAKPEGHPHPSLSWSHNNQPVYPSSRVAISEHEIFISRSEKSDSGRYFCIATNLFGTKRSHPIDLLVKEKPEFAIRPSDKIIKLGDTVIFNCQIRGDPTPTVFWRRDNAPITQSRSSVLPDKSLRIDQVQASDVGIYICYSNGSGSQLKAEARLEVIASPNFSKTPDDRQVQVGSSTRFDCVATGSPEPTVRWRFEDQDFLLPESKFEVADQGLGNQRSRIQTFHNGSLFIREVSKSDEGKYECRASTGSGTVKSSAVLSVLDASSFPIPVIDLPPQNVTVKHNDPFELHCSAFQHNVQGFIELGLTYEWYKEGNKVGEGPMYRVNFARNDDAGIYTCIVTVYDLRNIKHKTTQTRSSAVVHVGDQSLPLVQNLPAPVDSFDVKQSGETWVVLEWSPLMAPGQTVSYVIEIANYKPFYGWSVVKDHLFGTVAKLDGLSPNTGYYLMLRAVVEDKVGRPKMLNKVFFTKSVVVSMNMDSSEMRMFVSQMVLSSHKVWPYGVNEVLTSWAICGRDGIVGKITQFNVIYTPVGIGNCTQRREIAPPRCPHNSTHGYLNSIHPLDDPNFCFKNVSNWQERLPPAPRVKEYQEKQMKLTVDPRKPIANVMIKELEPFTCYQVAAQAVMGNFLSQRSDIVSVLTYGQAPGQSPTQLAYQWKQNGSILRIHWTPPSHQLNGLLLGYLVRVMLPNGALLKEIETDEQEVKLEGVPRNQTLNAVVGALNCHGEGRRSDPLRVLSFEETQRLAGMGTSSARQLIASIWPAFIALGLIVCLAMLFVLLCWRNKGRRKRLSKEKLTAASQQSPLMGPVEEDHKKAKKGLQQQHTNGLLFRHPPDSQASSHAANLMMEQALQKAPPYNPMMYAPQEVLPLPYDSDANAYADPVLFSAQPFCGAAVPYMGMVNSGNNTGSTMLFAGQPSAIIGAHNSPPNTNNSSSGFCAGTGGSCSTPSSSHRNNAMAQQQDTASPYASASIFNAQDNGEEEFAGSRLTADFARSIPPPPQYPPPPVPRSGGSSNSDLVDDYAPERKSNNGSSERRKKRQSTPSSARHGKSSKEKKFLLGPGSSTELQLLNQQIRPQPATDRGSGHDEAAYDSQTSSGHHYTYYCDLNGNTTEPRAAYMLDNHQSPVYLDSQVPLKPKPNGGTGNYGNFFSPIEPARSYNNNNNRRDGSNHFIPISPVNGPKHPVA